MIGTLDVRSPIYYGWWVLIAGALAELLSIGATSYSAGLFVLPLQQEFALSRAAANSAFTILFAGAAIMAPLVGYLLDRFPAQHVMGFAAAAFGLGFAVISLTSSLIVMVLALVTLVAFGGMATGPLTASTLTSRWFYRRRGRALGIATVATSGGGIVVAPLLGWGIENYGWRTALLIEAIAIFLIVSALAAFVIRSGPAELGLEAHKENEGRPKADIPFATGRAETGNGSADWSYGRILSTLNFWAVGFVLAALSGIYQAIVVTLVPYGSELGFTPGSAVLLISAFSVTAAVVKVLSGFLAEFIERRTILLFGTVATILSLSLLLSSSSYPMLIVACCLAGTGLGCLLPSSAALVATCFGSPSFGRVMGLIYVAVVISSVVSVAFIGAIFDRTKSYALAFEVFLGIAVIAAFATLIIRTPVQQRLNSGDQAADSLPAEPVNIVAKGSPR